MTRSKRTYFCLWVLSVSLTAPGVAQAYLDPGSGSMLLQLLLGGLAGIAVMIRLWWHRIAAWFGFRRVEAKEVEPPDQ